MGKLVTCFNIKCDSLLSLQTVEGFYKEGEEILCPKCQSVLVDRSGNTLISEITADKTKKDELLSISTKQEVDVIDKESHIIS